MVFRCLLCNSEAVYFSVIINDSTDIMNSCLRSSLQGWLIICWCSCGTLCRGVGRMVVGGALASGALVGWLVAVLLEPLTRKDPIGLTTLSPNKLVRLDQRTDSLGCSKTTRTRDMRSENR